MDKDARREANRERHADEQRKLYEDRAAARERRRAENRRQHKLQMEAEERQRIAHKSHDVRKMFTVIHQKTGCENMRKALKAYVNTRKDEPRFSSAILAAIIDDLFIHVKDEKLRLDAIRQSTLSGWKRFYYPKDDKVVHTQKRNKISEMYEKDKGK